MKNLILIILLLNVWEVKSQHWVLNPSQTFEFNNPSFPLNTFFSFGFEYPDCYADELCGSSVGSITYVHDFCRNLNSFSPINVGIEPNYLGESCLDLKIEYLGSSNGHFPYSGTNCFEQSTQKEWRTGMIYSKPGLEYGYGKLDMHCRFPRGKGICTALWLWSNGEIDITELTNQDNGKVDITSSNLHSPNYCPKPPAPDLDGGNGGSTDHLLPFDLTDGFHKHTLEWTPDHLKFKIDDRIQWIVSKDNTNFFPNNPLDLIIASGVYSGTSSCPSNPNPCYEAIAGWSSATPDAQTMSTIYSNPEHLYVNYIRHYTEDPSCPNLVVCENNTNVEFNGYEIDFAISHDVDEDGIIDNTWSCNQNQGHEWNCPKTIFNGQIVTSKAEEYINLNDGFTAESGSDFIAEIVPCSMQRIASSPKRIIKKEIDEGRKGISEITVSPNPATSEIEVKILSNYTGVFILKLINSMGQVVLRKQVNSEVTNLSVSEYPRGVYSLFIENSDHRRIETQKVILN